MDKVRREKCSSLLQDMQPVFTRQFGEVPQSVEWLESKRFVAYKYTAQDLVDLADKYKEKLAKLRESPENL